MARSDDEPSSSEESDCEDEVVMPIIPLGTLREFTASEEDRNFLMENFNSTHLVTRRLPYLIMRSKAGVLGAGVMFHINYYDEKGVYWRETEAGTERLGAVTSVSNFRRIDPCECTNAEGVGKVTVYSDEPLEGQYWVRELAGYRRPAHTPCYIANDAIPRCVRQLKVKTLEDMAPYLNTDPLSVITYFSRCRIPDANLKGNVCHMFMESLGKPSGSVYVAPISRSELEGVTLLRIEDQDYSLASGRRVGYEKVGDVFHVYEEGGSLRRIDDDALVGCEHCRDEHADKIF